MNAKRHTTSHSLLSLCGWLFLTFTAASSGYFVRPDGWYAALNKPSWNPPSWLFGPAWTLLYILMAVAAWLVWKEGGWKKQGTALGLFLLQWALNALWTPLFFGLHRPDLALLDIALLWASIIATLIAFLRVKRAAGLLLIPYLVWVTFAAFLNFTIWRMNG
ncbi:MAG: tryptophan-rich sensory protein [Gloeobacteraceae cyanobacterium ES-bin-144]|nr:tryptophan-rich sensory protein [Verrucomicrobiales bacterium]